MSLNLLRIFLKQGENLILFFFESHWFNLVQRRLVIPSELIFMWLKIPQLQ